MDRWLKWLAALAVGFLLVFFFASPAHGQDYGDAPDPYDSCYPVPAGQPAIIGKFPTLFNTSNSRVGNPGVHHLVVGEEWFGPAGAVPSAESDANDPLDPDGRPNLVNNDSFDDGLPPIPFWLVLTSIPPAATITFQVTVPAGAPDIDRYVNILIDWDRSGDWKLNPAGVAEEWVVKNLVVRVTPGTTQWITTPPFAWGLGAQLSPQIFWMRMNLSRTILDPSPAGPWYAVGGWDGSGVFSHGETEDYLFHPGRHHNSPPPWNPPGPPRSGGYYSFLPGIEMVPQSQDVAHGTPATVSVQLVDNFGLPITSPEPDFLGWAIDAAIGGPPSVPPAGFMVGPSSYTDPTSGTTATWTPTPGGAPGLGTITVTSVTHDCPSPEEWAFRMRAKWDGVRAQTRKAIVHIWHTWPGWPMGPTGVWGISSHFTILLDTIDRLPTISPDNKTVMLGFANGARTAWRQNDHATMLAQLDSLDDKARECRDEGEITEDEYNDIHETIYGGGCHGDGIRAQALGLGRLPVPDWAAPLNGHTVRGGMALAATTESPDVVRASFSAMAAGGASIAIGDDLDGTDGWSVPWDTSALPDGVYQVSCTMENTVGDMGQNTVAVWVDNSVPAPTPPPLPHRVCGLADIAVTVADENGDVESCAFAITPDGVNWFTLPTDYGGDGDETYLTQIESGQLEPGMYQARATTTDAAGNEAIVVWPMEVLFPNYTNWKLAYGVTDDNEDNDCDGIGAIYEYYFGTSPAGYDPSGAMLDCGIEGDNFVLRCQRNPVQDGLTASIQESTDLEDWTPGLVDPAENSVDRLDLTVTMDTDRKFPRPRVEQAT